MADGVAPAERPSMKMQATDPPFQFSLKQLLLAVVVVSIALAIFVPLYRWSKRNADKNHCTNNLRQIGVALHTYHDTWKCFPPVMWTDKAGKPMHSWRVLIGPQIESSSYFDQYNFNEPWDGPSNRKLHSAYAFVWRCPSDTRSPEGMTNYVAIYGPGTAWDVNRGTPLRDFKDGPSNTILVVEIRNSDIHHMEPRDIDIRNLKLRINAKSGPSIGSYHIEGALVALATAAFDGWTKTRLPSAFKRCSRLRERTSETQGGVTLVATATQRRPTITRHPLRRVGVCRASLTPPYDGWAGLQSGHVQRRATAG